MIQSEVKEKKAVSRRQKEIVTDYLEKLDHHVRLLKNGETDKVLEVREFAEMMHLHPVYLSNTVKEVTG